MIPHLLLIFKTSMVTKMVALIFGLGVTLLAVGEATQDRTLIIISAITSGTSLIGVIISAGISLHNSKKLAVVAELPQKVEEFRKEVDGRMTELKVSRLETSQAKQEVARAEGVQQERTEERDRVSNTAITDAKTPVKMEMVNSPDDPANVRTVKDKKSK